MPSIDPQSSIDALKTFSEREKNPLRVIPVEGLALHYYGIEDRSTIDIDSEVDGNLESLFEFLKSRKSL